MKPSKVIVDYQDTMYMMDWLWDYFYREEFDEDGAFKRSVISQLQNYIENSPYYALLGVDLGEAFVILSGLDDVEMLLDCVLETGVYFKPMRKNSEENDSEESQNS